jgi:hypothetical protein
MAKSGVEDILLGAEDHPQALARLRVPPSIKAEVLAMSA